MPRPKLGNDPFLRGAAARPEPAPKRPARERRSPKKAPPAEALGVLSEAASVTDFEAVPVVVPEPLPTVGSNHDGVVPPPSAPSPASGEGRSRSERGEGPARAGPDPFGREPAFEARSLRALEVLYRRYFRVDARGLANVPSTGPVLLVANRAGAVPWDVAMLKCAVALEHPAGRRLRPLADEAMLRLPLVGSTLTKFGAVRASPESARGLLQAGEAVAVFPEGSRGADKGFLRRYRLEPFGRGGFVKLAAETGATVVPVAIIGAEEAHPRLTPRLPWLGPLGLWPVPSKWVIEFGEPVRFDAARVADAAALERSAEQVRRELQARIDRVLRTRRGIFR